MAIASDSSASDQEIQLSSMILEFLKESIFKDLRC